MARFRLTCTQPNSTELKYFWYDNMTSEILNDDMTPIPLPEISNLPKYTEAFATSKETPAGKSHDIKKLKIQLGLSCNYACTYCNQRFVPHAAETNADHISPFLAQLPSWFDGGPSGDGDGIILEFWGGEPFVYWKTLKPLAEKLREMYPKIKFVMITNGSLLDREKNQWLYDLGFSIGVSHDGPGYHVRGKDPLDDPTQMSNIMDLWFNLGPEGRMSFNCMMNKNNQSRAAVQEFFQKKLGFIPPIGEGAFIDPYDEGGKSTCFTTLEEHQKYRFSAFHEIRSGAADKFTVVRAKIGDFMDSIATRRPATSLGQKCGMDSDDNIAVDLKGNVLTCQNVSPVSKGFNGESHLLGKVTDWENIKLKTATHWSHRDECVNCPVLQVCKGSCMFLHGDYWELGCDASYSDAIPFFANAFEVITGCVPIYIEGPQKADRKDIFGLVGNNLMPETANVSF